VVSFNFYNIPLSLFILPIGIYIYIPRMACMTMEFGGCGGRRIGCPDGIWIWESGFSITIYMEGGYHGGYVLFHNIYLICSDLGKASRELGRMDARAVGQLLASSSELAGGNMRKRNDHTIVQK